MRYVYLTALENPESVHIKNQVLPICNSLNARYIAIIPLFLLSKKKIALIDRTTKHGEAKLRSIFPSYFAYMHVILLPIFIVQCLLMLRKYIFLKERTVFHCRGLLSSIVAVSIKMLNSDIRVIYDIRGLYCDEGVVIGRWRLNGINYRLWRKIDNIVKQKADVLTGVSPNIVEENFQNKFHFIPACTSKNFKFSPSMRSEIRDHYGIREHEIVLIYTGALGLWHDEQSLTSMIENLGNLKNLRVILLTDHPLSFLKNTISEKIPILQLKVAAHEVSKYLSASDVGLLPGSSSIDHSHKVIMKTMISSKAQEYLCSGLMLSYNDNIDYLVKITNNVKTLEFFANDADERMRRSIYFSNIFDVQDVYKKYASIRDQLFK